MTILVPLILITLITATPFALAISYVREGKAKRREQLAVRGVR